MSALVRFGALFDREPFQYGLRGDRQLWLRMQAEFADRPLPASLWDVRSAVEDAYARQVGRPLEARPDPGEAVFVRELSIGSGMSDGSVSPHFWRFTAVPLLIDRWAEKKPDP